MPTYKKGGTIDTDTPILPMMVADNVANDFIRSKYPNPTPQQMKDAPDAMAKLSDHLVEKADRLYKDSPYFKKVMNKAGNKGLDALYTFMHHWAQAYDGKAGKKGFKSGGPITGKKFRAYTILLADEYGHRDESAKNKKPSKFYISWYGNSYGLSLYENRQLDNYIVFDNEDDLKKAIDKVRYSSPNNINYGLNPDQKFFKEFLPESKEFEYKDGGTVTVTDADVQKVRTEVLKKISEFKNLEETDIAAVVRDKRIIDLLSAGYNTEEILEVFVGYGTVHNVNIDNEFAETYNDKPNGLFTFQLGFIDGVIDYYVDNANKKQFELGLKYPNLNWSDIVKKYKIDKNPTLIKGKMREYGNKKEVYEYQIFQGKNVVIGSMHQRLRYIDGKLDDDKDMIYPLINDGQFNKDYWGIVSSDKSIIKDIAKMICKKSDGYVKDMDIYINGVGGLQARDLTDAIVSFKAGGKIDGTGQTLQGYLDTIKLPRVTALGISQMESDYISAKKVVEENPTLAAAWKKCIVKSVDGFLSRSFDKTSTIEFVKNNIASKPVLWAQLKKDRRLELDPNNVDSKYIDWLAKLLVSGIYGEFELDNSTWNKYLPESLKEEIRQVSIARGKTKFGAMMSNKGYMETGGQVAEPGFAEILREQLGPKTMYMLGAYNLVKDDKEKSFSFRIRGSKKANHIKIFLAPDDTYTMEFGIIRKPRMGLNLTPEEYFKKYEDRSRQ